MTGIEAVAEIRPRGPVSGYFNVALNHAYGYGPITGGFFPTAPPTTPHDLDHDQRLSVVASGLYSHQGLFVSVTGIYGSGLISATPPDSTYRTGLLAFDKKNHVDPADWTTRLLRSFVAWLHEEGYAKSTVARRLAALRSFG